MKKCRFHRLIFNTITLILALSALNISAEAHGPRFTHIATSAQIAEDADGLWDAQNVALGKYDSYFGPIDKAVPNLNFTTSTFWIKFTITNGTDRSQEYYLETARSVTNHIRFYETNMLKARLMYETGDEFPFEKRPVIYRKFLFPISLEPNESKDFMISVTSDGEVINLPLKLWEPSNFHGFAQRENLTLGMYYGLLIIIAMLFLFFGFIVKNRIYHLYTLYVAFLFFMQASLDGLAFEYIWPNSPWMASHSVLIFSSLSVFTLMYYAADFLRLKKTPKTFQLAYKILMGLVAVCAVTSLLSGFLYEITFPLINGLSLISLLTILIAIFWVNKNVSKVNPLFALGFLTVLAGGIVFILTNFSIIENDFLSANAIKLGSAGEVIFLSLAMVNRYRQIQKEGQKAKREAYENLEKLNKITSEQNAMLEQQVKERTQQITKQKEELEVKNNEIIDSITYAKRIQDAILPPDDLVNKELHNGFILYLPKDIVAGDFYWLEPAKNNVFIAAADCTGHGVPGAMVSVVCHNALNRSVREFGLTSPSKILDQTARLVDETFEQSNEEIKDGMDISLCKIDQVSRQVEWAGANNPLWIISKHDFENLGEPSLTSGDLKLFEIKADKQPIGKYVNREAYTHHKVSLNEGDVIYMFSDGFPDQFGGDRGKKYKSKNFKRYLLAIAAENMTDQKTSLKQEFEQWRGELEQLDDVCVIGVRI